MCRWRQASAICRIFQCADLNGARFAGGFNSEMPNEGRPIFRVHDRRRERQLWGGNSHDGVLAEGDQCQSLTPFGLNVWFSRKWPFNGWVWSCKRIAPRYLVQLRSTAYALMSGLLVEGCDVIPLIPQMTSLAAGGLIRNSETTFPLGPALHTHQGCRQHGEQKTGPI